MHMCAGNFIPWHPSGPCIKPGTVLDTEDSTQVIYSPCSQGYPLAGEVLWTRVTIPVFRTEELEDAMYKRELSRVLAVRGGFFEASAVYKSLTCWESQKDLQVGRSWGWARLHSWSLALGRGLKACRSAPWVSAVCPRPGLLTLRQDGNKDEGRYWFL